MKCHIFDDEEYIRLIKQIIFATAREYSKVDEEFDFGKLVDECYQLEEKDGT